MNRHNPTTLAKMSSDEILHLTADVFSIYDKRVDSANTRKNSPVRRIITAQSSRLSRADPSPWDRSTGRYKLRGHKRSKAGEPREWPAARAAATRKGVLYRSLPFIDAINSGDDHNLFFLFHRWILDTAFFCLSCFFVRDTFVTMEYYNRFDTTLSTQLETY